MAGVPNSDSAGEEPDILDVTSMETARLDSQKRSMADPTTGDQQRVDFDGPEDSENPMNWPSSKKKAAIALVSIMVMLSHIGSTICASAASEIMMHFRSDNQSLSAFVTTIYLVGYAFGPIAIAPLSELYGRAILYKICMALGVIFNVACAVSNSLELLIFFRLLAGVAASSPVTLGPGSIADMVAKERRAWPMATFVVGAVFGPALGPICGGYLTPALGWRWAFWLMAVASAVVMVITLIIAQESYPYVLLKRKTKRLRKETGNSNLKSVLDTNKSPGKLFAFSITRPLRMLLSPMVFLISLYVAVVYSYMYLCFTTFPRVFGDQYGFDSGQSGLATLGLGVGSLGGVAFCGSVADGLSVYLSKKNKTELLPEYRLPTMAVGGICVPIGLFWYGWTAETKTHWIAPIIGTGFLGAGLIITYMASTMYLIDVFTVHAASVTAASTILRCLCGALLPLAGDAMYDKLGIGWGTSVLGFISVAFLPLPFIFYLCGQRIRGTHQSAKY